MLCIVRVHVILWRLDSLNVSVQFPMHCTCDFNNYTSSMRVYTTIVYLQYRSGPVLWCIYTRSDFHSSPSPPLSSTPLPSPPLPSPLLSSPPLPSPPLPSPPLPSPPLPSPPLPSPPLPSPPLPSSVWNCSQT